MHELWSKDPDLRMAATSPSLVQHAPASRSNLSKRGKEKRRGNQLGLGEKRERDALMVRRSLREEGSFILVGFPWPWPAMVARRSSIFVGGVEDKVMREWIRWMREWRVEK